MAEGQDERFRKDYEEIARYKLTEEDKKLLSTQLARQIPGGTAVTTISAVLLQMNEAIRQKYVNPDSAIVLTPDDIPTELSCPVVLPESRDSSQRRLPHALRNPREVFRLNFSPLPKPRSLPPP